MSHITFFNSNSHHLAEEFSPWSVSTSLLPAAATTFLLTATPGTRKRAADESAGPATRSSKVAKTKKAASPGKAAKGGKGAKAAPSTSNFKAKALPIHINMTHTPASIDEDTVSAASKDPGSLGSVTLLPSTFSTGSYGWKGSKRITVELQNTDNGEEKETVQVMVT